MREQAVAVAAEPGVTLAATLCLPEDASAERPAPAMALFGGTFGDTRDGDMDPARNPYAADAPRSGLLRRIAHALAAAGVATLRFDKRGCGESGGGVPSDAGADRRDAVAVTRALRGRPEIDGARVGAAGHSAGASHVCALAHEIPDLACAGLLGMLYGSSEELIRQNWGRVRAVWARLSEDRRAWLRAHRPREVVGAFRTEEFLAAAARGDERIALDAEGVTHVFELRAFRQAMERHASQPRIEQLRAVRCPTLLLHGAEDLNVRVEDALDSFRALRETGSEAVTLVVLPGLDHNYQPVAADPVERMWERVSFRSQGHPVDRTALDALAAWAARALDARVPPPRRIMDAR